jgi:exodeoxyribonuclease X
MKLSAAVIDTETTGFKAPIAPVQFVYYPVHWSNPADMTPWNEPMVTERFHPGEISIEFGAMATHGITLEDVKNAPPWEGYEFPYTPDYFVGHSVDYDIDVIRGALPEAFRPKAICTLALSQLIFPKCDSHKLVALAYYMAHENLVPKAYQDRWQELIGKAHDAEADVHMASALFLAICKRMRIDSWEKAYQYSEIGRLPVEMPFGKYKGYKMWEVPNDYRRWLSNQSDVEANLLRALTMPKDEWAEHNTKLEEIRNATI